MKHYYLLKAFLFVLISIFLLLLLEIEIFELLQRTISSMFLITVFCILLFWILSIHSFYNFTSLLNEETIAREADRLQIEESQKLIQTLRSQRHDFKNQLQVIRVMAQFQRNNEIVDYIQDCNMALDFSKVIPSQIDNPAISAMIIYFATQARENGVNFEVDSDIDFAAYNLSPAKTTRILGNIIQNAIESFQITSQKDRTIQLTMWEKDDNFHFLIWNNGPPIPEEIHRLIFLSGYSLKNSTGLGLAIVKQLVDEMEGKVSVKSSIEEGTEFRITIPKLIPEPRFTIAERHFSEKTVKTEKA
ncbi:MAG: sensor histidine kinase [Bacteroidota bacterium]